MKICVEEFCTFFPGSKHEKMTNVRSCRQHYLFRYHASVSPGGQRVLLNVGSFYLSCIWHQIKKLLMNNDWHRYVYLGILSIVFVGCIYIICYNTLFIIFLTVYFTCWVFFFIMMVVMTQSETLRNSVTARDVDVEMMTLDVNWLSTRTTHTHTYSNTHTMAIKSHLKLRKLGGCRESVAAARVVKDSQTTGTGPWQHNTAQHSWVS